MNRIISAPLAMYSITVATVAVLCATTIQQQMSTVEQSVAIKTTIQTVEIDGVELDADVIDTTTIPVVIIKTGEAASVIAQEPGKWPPQTLRQYKPGRFLLRGEPGSTWQITVVEVRDGIPYWEFHTATIGDSAPAPTPDPPPAPPEPDPSPGDWGELTNLVKGSIEVGFDRSTSLSWAAAIEREISSDSFPSDLSAARTHMSEVRRNVFNNRTNFNVDWRPVFKVIDKYLADHPPANTTEYKDALQAIANGLKE